MRRVALLYNLSSGIRRQRRLEDVEAAAAVLRADGIDVTTVATRGPGLAGEQAREAAAAGCDTVLACGGDGTLHDVLQGVVGTPTALGLIPLGTGNALATDLALSRNPAAAARQMLAAAERRIAVGKMEFHDRDGRPGCRYFAVIAGIGVDAQMLYALNVAFKERYGMTAYYLKAMHLFMAHPFVPFEFEMNGRRERVYQALAVRVQRFGGILRRLSPESGLERNELAFALFRTRSRLSYALYVLRGFLQQRWAVPGMRIVHGTEAVCRPVPEAEGRRLYAEADGEVLGGLPARISVVPDAVTLLMPVK